MRSGDAAQPPSRTSLAFVMMLYYIAFGVIPTAALRGSELSFSRDGRIKSRDISFPYGLRVAGARHMWPIKSAPANDSILLWTSYEK